MKALKIIATSTLILGLWACEKQGPIERIGEEVDEAVEDVRNGGETVGNKLDDAADDVRDGIDDARKELEE
jgi:hypothetical protein